MYCSICNEKLEFYNQGICYNCYNRIYASSNSYSDNFQKKKPISKESHFKDLVEELKK